MNTAFVTVKNYTYYLFFFQIIHAHVTTLQSSKSLKAFFACIKVAIPADETLCCAVAESANSAIFL